jgi:hypothetical protein
VSASRKEEEADVLEVEDVGCSFEFGTVDLTEDVGCSSGGIECCYGVVVPATQRQY